MTFTTLSDCLAVVAHPAKFSASILELLKTVTAGQAVVLDTFAGTGLIHELAGFTVSVELEPEWSALRSGTLVGDALALPLRSGSVDCVATSPTYGNRMADHHDAKDASVRHTYRHTLGRALHPNNSGQLQWGPKYQDFHRHAWREVARVLKPGGLFVLNVSDHIRAGQVIEVSRWHLEHVQDLGFMLIEHHQIATSRQRHGQNGALRVDHENVYVLNKDPG